MITIGIDPGVNGGVAVNYGSGVVTYHMPDSAAGMKHLFQNVLSSAFAGPVYAYVEDVPKFVGVIPGARVAVLFQNFGRLEGVLTGLGIPVTLVRPQAWQKPLNLGTTRRASGSTTIWKNKLKAEAQKRFPGVKVTLATADALLILDYATKQTS